MKSSAIVAIALLLGQGLAADEALALKRGKTDEGIAWVSGGVGLDEVERLRTDREFYSFWLTTAALKSGAFLADVRVRILEAQSQRVVLEQVLDGPWLFADLPAGRYEIEAIHQPAGRARLEIQRGVTQIHAGDRHQMVLYFAVPDVEREPAVSGR
ncbi:MAG: carboxypeptidase regulatory-like domain-containing protein [Piscinibacter sp.]|nr:carboxypeptidase regulatory-like domain-containing protein [Piscinibacter sp.]